MFKFGLRSISDIDRAAQKTIATFSRLLDKQLVLGEPTVFNAATDGYSVFVRQTYSSAVIKPFVAKEVFYRKLEHCLAHIVFESNARARALFVDSYAKAIEKVCKESGIVLDSVRLARFIDSALVIVEDARILSNWEKLYPGSASDLVDLRKIMCSRTIRERENASGLLALMTCAASGVAIEYAEPSILEATTEAIGSVCGCSFVTTLKIVKWLVTKGVDAIVERWKCSRCRAMELLLEHVEDNNSVISSVFVSWTLGTSISSEQVEQDNKTVSEALNTDTASRSLEDLDLNSDREGVQKFAESVLVKLGSANNRFTYNGHVTSIPARVTFSESANPEVTVQSDNVVSSMRAHFTRVLGRQRARLEEHGVQPDIGSVIQQRVSGRRQPIWLGSCRCRGFTALVLVDLSISMLNCVSSINSAATAMSVSMSFNFSKVLVWGFQSLDSGRVDIVRFTNNSISPRDIGGLTPLHFAIRAAADYLKRTNDAAHLFVVTDSYPVFMGSDANLCDTDKLIEGVRNEVQRARKFGVGVSCIALESEESMSREGVERMFGPSRYWITLKDELDYNLVRLVTGSFERYLRSSGS